MSKVKQIIEKWDTDRIGNDAEYHYETPEMTPDQDARKLRVSADDLRSFIDENGLNQFQTDVDEFKSYEAHDYLMDNWDDVAEQYWLDIAQPMLEQSYNDAVAYIQSYIEKAGHPLTAAELKQLNRRVYTLYKIQYGREAA